MRFLKKYNWLIPSALFSVAMILSRNIYTSNVVFIFLLWNLFLAVVPLYFSHKALQAKKNIYIWMLSGAWLLFFPNAMYIVTDLFHLRERPDAPLWFDLLLLFSTALNGIIMGFLSLYNIEKLLVRYVSRKVSYPIVFLFFVLCGYGVYLGRYERWNSWDVITQPYGLLYDIAYDIVHPFRNKQVWALSASFAMWMFLLYRMIFSVRSVMRKQF